MQGALKDLDVPNLLLDLFFTYEWSSILHQVISSAILFALDPEESNNIFMQKVWLRTYLVSKLMKTYYAYREKVRIKNSPSPTPLTLKLYLLIDINTSHYLPRKTLRSRFLHKGDLCQIFLQ